MALGGARGLRQVVEIARVLAMIQNDLLIKIAKVVEHEGKIRNSESKTKLDKGNSFGLPVSYHRVLFETLPDELIQFFACRAMANTFDDLAREGMNEHPSRGLHADSSRAQIED